MAEKSAHSAGANAPKLPSEPKPIVVRRPRNGAVILALLPDGAVGCREAWEKELKPMPKARADVARPELARAHAAIMRGLAQMAGAGWVPRKRRYSGGSVAVECAWLKVGLSRPFADASRARPEGGEERKRVEAEALSPRAAEAVRMGFWEAKGEPAYEPPAEPAAPSQPIAPASHAGGEPSPPSLKSP